MTDTAKTVREIALEQPTSIRVFERLGIDYCCGGRMPLTEACSARNLDANEVAAAVAAAATSPEPAGIDWTRASLTALINHIVTTHHQYVVSELPRLFKFAEKLAAKHGERQPHLPALKAVVAELGEELTHHLGKEEHVLFPYISKLEASQAEGGAQPHHCFGSVTNPIAMMTREHDDAGAALAKIEQLTQNFTPPADACPTYIGFYVALKEFRHDLHQHIHLENNILFPRAIELENATQPAVA